MPVERPKWWFFDDETTPNGRDRVKDFERHMKEELCSVDTQGTTALTAANLYDFANDAIFVLDLKGQIIDLNRAGHERLGYAKEEIIGRSIEQFNSPASAKLIPERFAAIQAQGSGLFEVEHVHKGGALIQCESSVTLISLDGQPRILSVVRDLTERKRYEAVRQEHEQQLQFQNKIYAALFYTNQALLQCKCAATLFNEICRAAVDYGGIALAWVGVADGCTQLIKPVAHYGSNLEYLEKITISSSPKRLEGQGPTGTAYREQRSVVCQDFASASITEPWHALGAAYGWRASAAVGIGRGGNPYAVISFYHHANGAFDPLTVQLLEEMAKNIGFALDRFDLEEERQRTLESLHQSASRYQKIIQTSVDGILVVDLNGRILNVNAAYLSCSGYSLEEILQMHVQDLQANPQFDNLREQLSDIVKTGSTKFSTRHRTKNGSVWPVIASLVYLPDEACILGFMHDMTEYEKSNNELRVAARVFESQEAMMVTDVDHNVIRINRAFTQISGYAPEDVIGSVPPIFRPDGNDMFLCRTIWDRVALEGHWQGEVRDRRKTGETYSIWLTITAVKDNGGKATNYVASFLDLTRYQDAQKKIDNLAYYDQLTGLPNRRLALERLAHAIALSARNSTYGAILYLDVDHFKVINDTLGHDAGDLVLNEVASLIEATLRREDTVARIGGDEFVVMLENLAATADQALAQAKLVGDKLLRALSGLYTVTGKDFSRSVSIGVTLFHGAQQEVLEILKRADLAMYEAKRAGRNALRFFDPVMQEALIRRAHTEHELRRALDHRQFVLYFQRRVGRGGQLQGAEVLVRWAHPQRGIIAPLDFVPVAEESGLIVPIGQWILAEACRCLSDWQTQKGTRHLLLSVNVSAMELKQPHFVSTVTDIIAESGINPTRLVLEITESMLLENIDDYIVKLRQLRDLGLSFALDDFGTGYSSLSYLKKLPINELKIDKSFVKDLGIDKNDDAIVQTIVQMGQTLGMDVIAEGVETQTHCEILARYGCHNYQGYLFGKPVTREVFGQGLSRSRSFENDQAAPSERRATSDG